MAQQREISFSYYVVMQDYGRRGLEAVVSPEMTRRNVIDRICSGEYARECISFIHFITMDDLPLDVTRELIAEASVLEAA